MKVLTVKNPWAIAIMLGKDIENRDWPTHHRGKLAIHASASMTRFEFDDAVDLMEHIVGFEFPYNFEETKAFNGKVLGTVDVTGCVKDHTSKWFQGVYGFVLENPVRFETPVAAKGALGLWDWTDTGASV